MSHASIQIALTAYVGACGLLYVALIGRPRKPLTPADAVIQLLLLGLVIWAVWSL